MSGPLGSSQWMYSSGEYTIDQSLRFDQANAATPMAYLHRTPASAGSLTTWTFSVWVKRGILDIGATNHHYIFAQYTDESERAGLRFTTDDVIEASIGGASGSPYFTTKRIFRDPAAWYHLVWVYDSTNGTAADRHRLYVNGVRETSFGTEHQATSSEGGNINTAEQHEIGNKDVSDDSEFDGLMAEVHFIDGTALTAASFGETGSTWGNWKPKKYGGSHGTNGFYLPFKQDYSVEGMNTVMWKGDGGVSHYIGGVGFNPGLVWGKRRSLAVGHGLYDTMRGLPNQLGSNEQSSSNQLTMYRKFDPDGFTVGSDGAINTDGHRFVAWCWDFGNTYGYQFPLSAMGDAQHSTAQQKFGASSMLFDGTGDGVYLTNATGTESEDFFNLGSGTAGTLPGNFEGDFTMECWVRASDVSGNQAILDVRGNHGDYIELGLSGANWYVWGTNITDFGGSTTVSINTWYHVALVRLQGDLHLYQDGVEVGEDLTTGQIGGEDYSVAIGHYRASGGATGEAFNGYIDEVRISNKARYHMGGFTSPTAAFTSDERTLLLVHSDTSNGSTTFTDSSGATPNTTGTINSHVAVNDDYGQSMVRYVGTGSNATVGHGLSTAPECIFVKAFSEDGLDWAVMHLSQYGGGEGYRAIIKLNSDAPYSTSSGTTYWNDTAPTTSVFSVGTNDITNKSGTKYIAYCWDSKAGYSKFGHYTGNGQSTGNTTTLGFRPAWLMVKRTNITQDWVIYDTTRQAGTNLLTNYLEANKTSTEFTAGTEGTFTISDTGFTPASDDLSINGNGQTMMYMAFADTREFSHFMDQSGNNNDWNAENLNENDVMLDTPSNNFCTLNPLSRSLTSSYTPGLSNGNLFQDNTRGGTLGTMSMPSGKWYWEILHHTTSSWGQYGIIEDKEATTNSIATTANPTAGVFYWNSGVVKINGSQQSGSWTAMDVHDVLGIAYDADNDRIYFYLNNELQGTYWTPPALSNVNAGAYTPAILMHGNKAVANFGQDSSFAGHKTPQGKQDGNEVGDFFYEPPSGFLALCTSNLPEPTITPSEHFSTTLYTGNGSSNAITGVGHQPGFLWIKNRGQTASHMWMNAKRGFNGDGDVLYISPDVGGPEEHLDDSHVRSFDSDGFTLAGSDSKTNTNNDTYVAYSWKVANTFSGTTQGNGTLKAYSGINNQDAGISLVEYVGNQHNTGHQIPHHLGGTPDIIFIRRMTGDSNNMLAPFAGNNSFAADGFLQPPTNEAFSTSASYFPNPAATSTVVTLGWQASINGNDVDHMMWCFRSIEGFSKIGNYLGNDNADGAFVYTGFTPGFVLIKNTAAAGSWYIYDTSRPPIENIMKNNLIFDTGAGQGTLYGRIDILSNGFKLRHTDSDLNDTERYIYMAFAETPFKYANAR